MPSNQLRWKTKRVTDSRPAQEIPDLPAVFVEWILRETPPITSTSAVVSNGTARWDDEAPVLTLTTVLIHRIPRARTPTRRGSISSVFLRKRTCLVVKSTVDNQILGEAMLNLHDIAARLTVGASDTFFLTVKSKDFHPGRLRVSVSIADSIPTVSPSRSGSIIEGEEIRGDNEQPREENENDGATRQRSFKKNPKGKVRAGKGRRVVIPGSDSGTRQSPREEIASPAPQAPLQGLEEVPKAIDMSNMPGTSTLIHPEIPNPVTTTIVAPEPRPVESLAVKSITQDSTPLSSVPTAPTPIIIPDPRKAESMAIKSLPQDSPISPKPTMESISTGSAAATVPVGVIQDSPTPIASIETQPNWVIPSTSELSNGLAKTVSDTPQNVASTTAKALSDSSNILCHKCSTPFSNENTNPWNYKKIAAILVVTGVAAAAGYAWMRRKRNLFRAPF